MSLKSTFDNENLNSSSKFSYELCTILKNNYFVEHMWKAVSQSKPTRGHLCEVTIVKLYILPALISQNVSDVNSNYFRLKSCSKCIKTIFIKRYNTLPISKPTPTLGSYPIFHKISHIYPYPPPLPTSFSTIYPYLPSHIHIDHPSLHSYHSRQIGFKPPSPLKNRSTTILT